MPHLAKHNTNAAHRFINTDDADRFIPSRKKLRLDAAELHLDAGASIKPCAPDDASPAERRRRAALARTLLSPGPLGAANQLLRFDRAVPCPPSQAPRLDAFATTTVAARAGTAPAATAWRNRNLPCVRILDAPGLLDHLNLLDWSSSNLVAVALDAEVWIWNASTGRAHNLHRLKNSGFGGGGGMRAYVPSVAFSKDDSTLAVGTSTGQIKLLDAASGMQKGLVGRGRCSHAVAAEMRVASLSWRSQSAHGGALLACGSRTGELEMVDLRAPEPFAASHAHTAEVCGLQWSPSGALLASGSHDNRAFVWDARISLSTPAVRLSTHTAAVNAVAWVPWQHSTLATGGGAKDGCIRLWNVGSTCHGSSSIAMVPTGCQVCSITFCAQSRELISAHGYRDQSRELSLAHGYRDNSVILWKCPSLVKVSELTGHTERVLHMAQSPDGTTIVTGSADETLRFWSLVGKEQVQQSAHERSRLWVPRAAGVALSNVCPGVESATLR